MSTYTSERKREIREDFVSLRSLGYRAERKNGRVSRTVQLGGRKYLLCVTYVNYNSIHKGTPGFITTSWKTLPTPDDSDDHATYEVIYLVDMKDEGYAYFPLLFKVQYFIFPDTA